VKAGLGSTMAHVLDPYMKEYTTHDTSAHKQATDLSRLHEAVHIHCESTVMIITLGSFDAVDQAIIH